MDVEYTMTNDELKQAIEDAWQMTRNTAPVNPAFKAVNAHYAKLLEIQAKRAALVSVPSKGSTP